MSQLHRVLKAARGFDGVCQADFSGAETVDGGPIISRVGARLYDLEQQGHRFEHIGMRHRTKVFRLIEAERSADARRDEGGLSAAVDEHAADSPAQPGQGVSASLSPESVEAEQKKSNTTNDIQIAPDSSKDLEPASLFKTPVGKPQFGYADQGELDAA